MKIKKLDALDIKEFVELIELFADVFEMGNFEQPDKYHLKTVLAKPNLTVIVAIENDLVVGGLTLYMLDQYYSVKPLAYLYDLAVSKDHQRKGVGKQLIAYTTEFCRDNGYEEVFVQADKADEHAIEFYRSTTPTAEEDVSHFYYLLR